MTTKTDLRAELASRLKAYREGRPCSDTNLALLINERAGEIFQLIALRDRGPALFHQVPEPEAPEPTVWDMPFLEDHSTVAGSAEFDEPAEPQAQADGTPS